MSSNSAGVAADGGGCLATSLHTLGMQTVREPLTAVQNALTCLPAFGDTNHGSGLDRRHPSQTWATNRASYRTVNSHMPCRAIAHFVDSTGSYTEHAAHSRVGVADLFRLRPVHAVQHIHCRTNDQPAAEARKCLPTQAACTSTMHSVCRLHSARWVLQTLQHPSQ